VKNPDDPTNQLARRDLIVSVGLLALVFVAVLCGLAHDENWRKFLRISIASFTYLAVLLSLTWNWRKRAGATRVPLPFWPFAVAAAVAELSSGWLRTRVAPDITFWLAPLAAALVGGIHWLALSYWRGLRERLTGRESEAPHALP
jgi:hypothetical protein